MDTHLIRTIPNIAQRLNLVARATHLPAFIFLTDEDRTPEPQRIAKRLPAGSAVLLRHYKSPKRKLLAHKLKNICHIYGLVLIIADDIELAIEVKADGLHLPEHRLMAPEIKALNWPRANRGFLTGAVHSPRALRKAIILGLDAVFVSPVFRSASHPERRPIGLMRFKI